MRLRLFFLCGLVLLPAACDVVDQVGGKVHEQIAQAELDAFAELLLERITPLAQEEEEGYYGKRIDGMWDREYVAERLREAGLLGDGSVREELEPYEVQLLEEAENELYEEGPDGEPQLEIGASFMNPHWFSATHYSGTTRVLRTYLEGDKGHILLRVFDTWGQVGYYDILIGKRDDKLWLHDVFLYRHGETLLHHQVGYLFYQTGTSLFDRRHNIEQGDLSWENELLYPSDLSMAVLGSVRWVDDDGERFSRLKKYISNDPYIWTSRLHEYKVDAPRFRVWIQETEEAFPGNPAIPFLALKYHAFDFWRGGDPSMLDSLVNVVEAHLGAKDAYLDVYRALTWAQEGRYKEAIARLKALQLEYPELTEPLLHEVYLYMQAQDGYNLTDALRRAFELDPYFSNHFHIRREWYPGYWDTPEAKALVAEQDRWLEREVQNQMEEGGF